MQVLRQFSVPFKGLKVGVHNFDFDLNNVFFSAFEDSPIQKADLKAGLELDRKPDHMTLHISVDGTVEAECDRCTSIIQLPLSYESDFIIKFDEEEREDDEIIYIHPDSDYLKFADLLYEQTLLAMPMIKVYNCEDEKPRPCNKEVLDILNNKKEEDASNNPFGEVLKDLKITKNN